MHGRVPLGVGLCVAPCKSRPRRDTTAGLRELRPAVKLLAGACPKGMLREDYCQAEKLYIPHLRRNYSPCSPAPLWS
jgi:hypothetical protein